MAGTGFGHRDFLVTVLRRRRHFFGPVFPVTILDPQGNRRPKGFPPAYSGTNLHFVLFNEHSTATTITLLAPPKIMVDPRRFYGESRGHPIDDHGQTRAMGLTRSEVTQHAGYPTLFFFGRLGGWSLG